MFTGYVDERTGADRLWLRFGETSTTVLRPVAWDAVTGIWQGSQAIPADQWREIVNGLRSPTPDDTAPQEPAASVELVPAKLVEPAPIWEPPSRVASVTFDAVLANWDADAAPDGLAVTVRPLDDWGRPVLVDGVVEVELQAAVRRDFNAAPHHRGTAIETLDRWSESLATAPLTADGYLFRLPFRADHASNDWVAARGRVFVKLVAPGHGVFEDARDAVPIRPFSPLNELQRRNPAILSGR
jgi:hypothetical protein